MIGICVFLSNREKFTNYFWPEEQPVVATTDSNTVEEVVTIDDVVSLRREIIENRKVDSIYLSMSDIELTAILMKIGTKATVKEIVDAYQRLKPQLKDVLLGADIAEKILQEKLDRQAMDTVPNRPPAITPVTSPK